MSQSDYITLKRTQNLLKLQEFPSVLTPNLYTSCMTYNLETTVANTKNSYSRLLPSGKTNIFTMEKSVANCPTFALCANTNQRPNRVLNTIIKPAPTFRLNKIYAPVTCTFTNGFVTRKCVCSKTVCKCGTDYCGSTKPGGISGHFSVNNLGA